MFYGPVVHDEFMVRARPEAEQQQKRCTLGIAVCLALSCFRHVFIVCFVVRLFVLSYFFHRLICPPLLFCFVFGCLFFVVYCVSCYFLRCYFVSCSLSIACFVVRLFVLSHSSAVWKASRKQLFCQVIYIYIYIYIPLLLLLVVVVVVAVLLLGHFSAMAIADPR